jgi:hypothetical protein
MELRGRLATPRGVKVFHLQNFSCGGPLFPKFVFESGFQTPTDRIFESTCGRCWVGEGLPPRHPPPPPPPRLGQQAGRAAPASSRCEGATQSCGAIMTERRRADMHSDSRRKGWSGRGWGVLPVRQIHNSHHLIFELGILITALAAGISTCVFAKTINLIIYCYTVESCGIFILNTFLTRNRNISCKVWAKTGPFEQAGVLLAFRLPVHA